MNRLLLISTPNKRGFQPIISGNKAEVNKSFVWRQSILQTVCSADLSPLLSCGLKSALRTVLLVVIDRT